MVDFALTIEDREERNRVARAIIAIMGNLNPSIRDQGDIRHKLWDHLAIISDFQLDIDSPYEPPRRERLFSKPSPLPYRSNEVKYMHYGRILESLINAAVQMKDGEEKDQLIKLIANHMKKSYLTWNKNVVNDDLIFKDLEVMSGGKIKVRDDLKLTESKDILSKSKKRKNPRKPDYRPNVNQRNQHE